MLKAISTGSADEQLTWIAYVSISCTKVLKISTLFSRFNPQVLFHRGSKVDKTCLDLCITSSYGWHMSTFYLKWEGTRDDLLGLGNVSTFVNFQLSGKYINRSLALIILIEILKSHLFSCSLTQHSGSSRSLVPCYWQDI